MRTIILLVLLSCLVFAPRAGHATAQPYQGIYTIIDPYNPPTIKLLKSAATTTCASQTHTVTTPYCGATNGILLRINWCDFVLYHVKNASGLAYPSCHYSVGYSNGTGSPGVELAVSDDISPCPGTYDTCSGTNQSVLGGTLALIQQINQQRATAGLAPLKISLGLSGGSLAPQTLIDAVGFVDVPYATSAGVSGCLRMPLPWTSTYISNFNRGLDQLISYVRAQLGADADIVIVKVGGITADSLEVAMPGTAKPQAAPSDPGSSGPGPALGCSSVISPGQVWLSAYNAAPIGSYTMAQANENTFGAVIGHAVATLDSDGLSGTLLSLPTTNGLAFPMVDCGIEGTTACVPSYNTGVWTTYYLEKYVDDLFDGGLAAAAAKSAYVSEVGGTFSLSPTRLSVNWTAVSPTPLVPSSQLTCILNNTNIANAPTDYLDHQEVQILGVGSVIGWQSKAAQGGECRSGKYLKMLNNGINDGGTFFEIETDAAFTDIKQCSAPLTTALGSILNVQAPGACQF